MRWWTQIDKYEVWPFGHYMAIFSWYLMLHKYIYRCSTIETLDFSTPAVLSCTLSRRLNSRLGNSTAAAGGGSRHWQDSFTFSLSGNNWMPEVQETIVNHGGHIKTRRGWSDIFLCKTQTSIWQLVGQTMSEKSCFGFWKVHSNRNSWKERMAQMTNNKTNSIKPAIMWKP